MLEAAEDLACDHADRSGCHSSKHGGIAMFAEENKALARRFFEEFVNRKDLTVADEIFAANHTYSDPSSPGIPTGPEGQKALIGAYTAAFPDLHHTVEEQFVDGNTVLTRWTGTGTHQGSLLGIPPTGKAAKIWGVWIHRIEGGKIVESKNVWDTLGMLQQLGIVPTLG
jgi:steroid delta-isomerase-like uncharacterized protein